VKLNFGMDPSQNESASLEGKSVLDQDDEQLKLMEEMAHEKESRIRREANLNLFDNILNIATEHYETLAITKFPTR
jgi:hypothetical protein